ncbi:larval cuticle protein LCP-17-like [Melitaea cinxia]|uniref:larval cuticle protein LCP-17-like n=1 Tax=Melitaea cinxia TaxID=113334 RepID=UPI001E270F9C|nr:larval cuticle protein LCP-17-like [Melitaea cinxia]
MKLLIITILVASVYADVSHLNPKTGEANAQILKLDNDVGVEGQYSWSIETENGIVANEQGSLKAVPGSDVPAETVQGQASWKSPEGEAIQLTYIADENGYQPQGSHLPTSPPIPPSILRSLEYIAAHPPPVEKN